MAGKFYSIGFSTAGDEVMKTKKEEELKKNLIAIINKWLEDCDVRIKFLNKIK